MKQLIKALLICHQHRGKQDGDIYFNVAIMVAESVDFEDIDYYFYQYDGSYGEEFLKRISRLRKEILSSTPSSEHRILETRDEQSDYGLRNVEYSLPTELIIFIAEYVAVSPSPEKNLETRRNLVKASQVCKLWYKCFTPLFYKYVELKSATEFDRFLAVTMKPEFPEWSIVSQLEKMAFPKKDNFCWFNDYFIRHGHESLMCPLPSKMLLYIARTFPLLDRVYYVEEEGKEQDVEEMRIVIQWEREFGKLFANRDAVFYILEKLRILLPLNTHPRFLQSAIKMLMPLLEALLVEQDFLNEKMLIRSMQQELDINLLTYSMKAVGATGERRARAQEATQRLKVNPYTKSSESFMSLEEQHPSLPKLLDASSSLTSSLTSSSFLINMFNGLMQ